MKNRVLSNLSCLLLLAMFWVGCAIIINEKEQKINVSTSNNSSIQGTIDGVMFKAPGTLNVARSKKDRVIMVDNPACGQSTIMASSVDPVFFINVLSGGPLGSSTDYATDKMWKYQDNIVIPCTSK